MSSSSRILELISRINSLKNKDTGLISSISKASRDANYLVEGVSSMVASLGELYSVGENLEEISSTLNILSINASIEATAAVGGMELSGQGFDNVAKQINKTSEDVSKEVSSFIKNRDSMQKVFLDMEKIVREISSTLLLSQDIIGEGDDFLDLIGQLADELRGMEDE